MVSSHALAVDVLTNGRGHPDRVAASSELSASESMRRPGLPRYGSASAWESALILGAFCALMKAST